MKRLSVNSIAYIDGRLQKDDRIVAINGNVIRGMTQGDALNMLKHIKEIVILTIHRSLSAQNNEENDVQPKNNFYQSDFSDQPDINQSVVSGLIRRNSEASLPTLIRKASKSIDKKVDGKGRKSRSEEKTNPQVRSQSETREVKRKSSTSSRSRSPGIFSRLFRGSDRSVKGDPSSKEKKSSSRKNSKVEMDKQVNHLTNELSDVIKSNTHTLYFDKTSASVDFTLTRDGKMYGDSPTIVQFIRKGCPLSKSLFMGDIILSINGLSLQDFSDIELKKFLRNLPKGTIPMVIQRS